MEDGLDEEQNVCNHGRKTFFSTVIFFPYHEKVLKVYIRSKMGSWQRLLGLDKCT